MKKNLFKLVFTALVATFFLSGCYESHYYHTNHHHSDRYDHRHHHTSSGVEVKIRG